MNHVLVGGVLGILTAFLLLGGIRFLASGIRHRRKMRDLRKKWEERNKWQD